MQWFEDYIMLICGDLGLICGDLRLICDDLRFSGRPLTLGPGNRDPMRFSICTKLGWWKFRRRIKRVLLCWRNFHRS